MPVATSIPGTGTGAGSGADASDGAGTAAGVADGIDAGDSNFGTSDSGLGKDSEDGLAYCPDEGLEARWSGVYGCTGLPRDEFGLSG